MIKTAHINLLESADLVELASATEDAAYPLYRLWDRNIGRPFKPTLAETLTLKITNDSAEAPLYPLADTLIIPEGHNLSGMTLSIQYSDDDIAYFDAVPQWTATGGFIIKSWPARGEKYWRFVITSPAVVPAIPEMFLTSLYEWERMPERPTGSMDSSHNIISAATSGGRQRFLVQGEPVIRRSYVIARCPLSMRDEFLALWHTLSEGKPFVMLDHEGQWLYGTLEGELELREVSHLTYSARLNIKQVLP